MTNLPDEVVGNTVLSSRWNVLLDKLQNAEDTDVRSRGRFWRGGTFAGTFGSFAAMASGSKPYYGVRAEDFIISGIGTAANPYNLSALEDAANALPVVGGLIFVKSGFWEGTKRSWGKTGQAGKDKHIIIMGEGCDLGTQNPPDGWGTVLRGTNGLLEVSTRRCLVDFYNIDLRATGSNTLLKYYNDGSDGGFDAGLPHLGGVRISNVKFAGGGIQLYFTGQSVSGFDSIQHWNVLIERTAFRLGQTALKIDDTNPTINGIFRGNFRHSVIQAMSGGRAIDVDIPNLKGDWTDLLIEDSGAGADYALYLRARRTEGFSLSNVDFGDNVNSTKTALLKNDTSGEMLVRHFIFHKDVDLEGFVDFQGGLNAFWGGPGVINTSNEGSIIIRKMRSLSLPIGTIANPQKVLIVRGVSATGFIGSGAAGASPYTYTNNDSYIEDVYLVGGTITDVQRGGTTLGATARQHTLAPGDSIVITHTGAPTIVRYGIS